MATWTAGLNYGYYLQLDVNQASQNIPGNYTTASWALYLVQGPTYYGYNNGYTSYWSTNIGGHGYSGSFTYAFPWSQGQHWLLLGSGSTNIGHASDGKYTNGSFSGSMSESAPLLGNATASGNLSFDTIPRATTPTVPSPMTLGLGYTIGLPRASGTTFTHVVEYSVGNTGWVTLSSNAETSYAWTPPVNLAAQVPNATSGTGSIRVTTKSGSTTIGSPVVVGFTFNVPSSVVPTFTTITHAESVAFINTTVGGYVQSLSKLLLTITGAAGAQGSTISSYKITVAGQTINASSGTTPNPISSSGTVAIVGTITDSRGRTATKTVNVTVHAYQPPKINSMTVERANSAGSPTEEGTYIRVNMNLSVTSLNVGSQKNQLQYKVYVRAAGASSWGAAKVTSSLGTGVISFNSYANTGTYGITSGWEVRVEAIDKFTPAYHPYGEATGGISTSAIFMHWDANNGIGIGKYREGSGVRLDVGGNTTIRGNMSVTGEGHFSTGVYTYGTGPTNEVLNMIQLQDSIRDGELDDMLDIEASEIYRGVVQRATQAEVNAGADNTKYVSPLRLKNRFLILNTMTSAGQTLPGNAHTRVNLGSILNNSGFTIVTSGGQNVAFKPNRTGWFYASGSVMSNSVAGLTIVLSLETNPIPTNNNNSLAGAWYYRVSNEYGFVQLGKPVYLSSSSEYAFKAYASLGCTIGGVATDNKVYNTQFQIHSLD